MNIKAKVIIIALVAMLTCSNSFAATENIEPQETQNVISNEVKTENTESTMVVTDEKEDVLEVEPIEKAIGITEEPEPQEMSTYLTDYEIDLISLVTMAEAEGESDHGKRLVIDTILNRVDSKKFPNTIHDVIYQKHQFSSMWNGRVDKCYVMESIRNLVIEESLSRTNSDVLFFTAGKYGKYGTPLFIVGNHYFSK